MKSVIKRILGTIPVLIGVVLLIFIMLRIVPGNAAAMLLGEHVDQATIDRLTEVMGLDKPVIVQFFDYLAGAIHGDLGISYKYNRAVTDMIIEAFPYTLELALLAARALSDKKGAQIQVLEIGDRIYNIERMFNKAAGMKPEDDRLPKRLLEEPVVNGPSTGMTSQLPLTLPQYYEARGWVDAFPTDETLKKLGLDECVGK